MARIDRIEILMVDLKPKALRTDAIQSFESQETPIVESPIPMARLGPAIPTRSAPVGLRSSRCCSTRLRPC